MPPATKRNSMPPPVRAIDAAKSSLQHLSDQERMITSRLLPPEDPVEAVFKPPEALPHSYLPNKPPKAAAALAAPVSLKLPKDIYRSPSLLPALRLASAACVCSPPGGHRSMGASPPATAWA